MIITLVEPFIRGESSLYLYNAGYVRINVGIITDHNNIIPQYVQRNWVLRNQSNNVVQSGTVNARLNTFDSYIELYGLTGLLYVLEIDNNGTNALCVISRSNDVTVINEFHAFTGETLVYGDLITIGTGPTYVRLSNDWDLYSRKSTGCVINGGMLYAYAPSRILTHIDGAPTSIDYEAFPGLPTIEVPVHRLPVLTRTAPYLYTVTPATRLSITWFHKDGYANTFDTGSAVSTLTLTEHTGLISFEVLPIY